MIFSPLGSASIADWRPGILSWVVFCAVVAQLRRRILFHRIGALAAAPNNHLGSGPDCAMPSTRRGRIDTLQDAPAILDWIITRPIANFADRISISTPDKHLLSGPDRSMRVAGDWRSIGANRSPGILGGIIGGTRLIECNAGLHPLPDQHLLSSPDDSL